MSEGQDVVDWVAAHDQARAEVNAVMEQRHPFVLVWHEGDPEEIHTTGMFQQRDEVQFAAGLLMRALQPGPWKVATDRPDVT